MSEYTISTAAELVKSSSLRFANMQVNDLNGYLTQGVKKVFEDHNSQVVSFREGTYALFVNNDLPNDIVKLIIRECYFNIIDYWI